METFNAFLAKRFSAKTVLSYSYSVSKFLTENPNAVNYNYQDIVNYFFNLRRENLSNAHLDKTLAAIKQYYNFLIIEKRRTEHPCKYFKFKSGQQKAVHFDQLFSQDELVSLLERPARYSLLKRKNQLIISMLVFQGLTSEELISLKLSDVLIDEFVLSIKSSRKQLGRKLDLHRSQILLLLDYMEKDRPKLMKTPVDWLILNKHGNRESVDNINSIIGTMQIIFPDRELTPMQIRKSVIANWLNVQNIPLSDVQLLAGHKWPSTTERYVRKDSVERNQLIKQYHPLEKMAL